MGRNVIHGLVLDAEFSAQGEDEAGETHTSTSGKLSKATSSAASVSLFTSLDNRL